MVSVSLFQETNIPEDSGARKMENFTFKAPRKASLFALLIASIYAFGCAVEGVVWLFFFYHNEFFRKLNKSVLDCQKVERNSKPSILFQYWYMLHQGFDRELRLPQNLPHRSGPQYSTNLEVWKVDQSLALRFRIPLRPDQSRQETEITNKQSLTLSWWIYRSSLISRRRYLTVIYFVSEISAQKENGTAGGSRHINFIEDKFSYLNIAVVSKRFVERSLQCALMCLESLPCFSFNLAAFPDNNDKLLCEHLPSDKYNNSEKFIPSNAFHHFSTWVSK